MLWRGRLLRLTRPPAPLLLLWWGHAGACFSLARECRRLVMAVTFGTWTAFSKRVNIQQAGRAVQAHVDAAPFKYREATTMGNSVAANHHPIQHLHADAFPHRPGAAPDHPHSHAAGPVADLVTLGGNSHAHAAPAPSRHDLQVASARRLLAQNQGNLAELPPQLRMALLSDLKGKHAGQYQRIRRGERQHAESERRDLQAYEHTMHPIDRAVGHMRTAANVVTMGGSEEAIQARYAGEKGNWKGAAWHTGAALLNCASAATMWMGAGGAVKAGSRVLGNAIRNPAMARQAMRGIPSMMRTTVARPGQAARSAPAVLRQTMRAIPSVARTTVARAGQAVRMAPSRLMQLPSRLIAARPAAWHQTRLAARTVCETLKTGEGVIHTAATVNGVPQAVHGAMNLPRHLVAGRYGQAAMDALDAASLPLFLSMRGLRRDLGGAATRLDNQAMMRGARQEMRQAGHSLGSHGPQVSDAALIQRIETGVAPDGRFSPTPTSTRFNSHIDWEITQRRAMRAIEQEHKVDLNKPPVGKEKFEIDLEHGRKVGSGYKGAGTKMKLTHPVTGLPTNKMGYSAQDPLPTLTATRTTIRWNSAAGEWQTVQHFPIERPSPDFRFDVPWYW